MHRICQDNFVFRKLTFDDCFDFERRGGRISKKKRLWFHQAWKKKPAEGEYSTLYKELTDDGTKMFEYECFRMSENAFNLLLSKLEIHLKKQDTYTKEKLLHQKNGSQFV
jgi:hypothetical protein